MVDILIADDEHLARETIKYLLSHYQGIGKILEANNGQTALELAQHHSPHIVMLDIEMPNLTGVEVAKQLPTTTSIIFVTAFSHFTKQLQHDNCLGFLLKPFKDEEFHDYFSLACDIQGQSVQKIQR